MAGLPIDFKEVVDAFGDIDAARHQPIAVAVLLDQTAPADLVDFGKSCFASTQANARVSVLYYEHATQTLPYGCDLAVIVAGFSQLTGSLAQNIRNQGIPVLVVTTMPEIVKGIALAAQTPLIDEDLIAPDIKVDPGALPAAGDYYKEPFPLDAVREAYMRQVIGEWIVGVFKEKKLAFALCFPFIRKPLALDAVAATSIQNAAVGAVVIIPGADMPVMTLNQAKMILQIAAAYGQKMGMERAKELLGVIGGAFAFRTVARQVAGGVPGFGWAVKGAIGYTGTLAMGHAAIAYFEASVAHGKPISEALETAKAEAQKVAAIARNETNPVRGVKAVAQSYTRTAAKKVRDVADRAIPAAQGVVNNIAEVAGSTPTEIGKKAFDSFCEATGTTPAELGKRLVRTALNSRKGR